MSSCLLFHYYKQRKFYSAALLQFYIITCFPNVILKNIIKFYYKETFQCNKNYYFLDKTSSFIVPSSCCHYYGYMFLHVTLTNTIHDKYQTGQT